MSTTTLPPFEMKQVGNNIELKLRRVPLSFADVWEARQGEDQEGNPIDKLDVSTSILLAKDTERGQAQIAAVKEAMKIARGAEWGENPPVIPADRLALQDGEVADDDGVKKARWEGYSGMMYLSAKKYLKAKTKGDAIVELREKHPVQILGPRKTAVVDGKPAFPILKESDDLIYSGAICDVIVQIYPYNGTGKGANGKNLPHRINCSLEAIKFVEHGTRLGAKRIDAQNAFDEEEGDDYESPTVADTPATSSAASQDPLG
jgi:hypothetical protein